MSHTEYTYECEKYPEDLARKVERQMKDGWIPLGAPVWQEPFQDNGKLTVAGWYQFLTRP